MIDYFRRLIILFLIPCLCFDPSPAVAAGFGKTPGHLTFAGRNLFEAYALSPAPIAAIRPAREGESQAEELLRQGHLLQQVPHGPSRVVAGIVSLILSAFPMIPPEATRAVSAGLIYVRIAAAQGNNRGASPNANDIQLLSSGNPAQRREALHRLASATNLALAARQRPIFLGALLADAAAMKALTDVLRRAPLETSSADDAAIIAAIFPPDTLSSVLRAIFNEIDGRLRPRAPEMNAFIRILNTVISGPAALPALATVVGDVSNSINSHPGTVGLGINLLGQALQRRPGPVSPLAIKTAVAAFSATLLDRGDLADWSLYVMTFGPREIVELPLSEALKRLESAQKPGARHEASQEVIERRLKRVQNILENIRRPRAQIPNWFERFAAALLHQKDPATGGLFYPPAVRPARDKVRGQRGSFQRQPGGRDQDGKQEGRQFGRNAAPSGEQEPDRNTGPLGWWRRWRIRRLEKQLAKGNFAQRAEAATKLQSLEAYPDRMDLIRQRKDLSDSAALSDQRLEAIAAARTRGATRLKILVPELSENLSDTDFRVRRAASEALAEAGALTNHLLLRRALLDLREPQTRSDSLQSLLNLGPDALKARLALIKVLQDPIATEDEIQAVFRIFTAFPNAEAAKALAASIVGDPDVPETLRRQAVQVIRGMAPSADIDAAITRAEELEKTLSARRKSTRTHLELGPSLSAGRIPFSLRPDPVPASESNGNDVDDSTDDSPFVPPVMDSLNPDADVAPPDFTPAKSESDGPENSGIPDSAWFIGALALGAADLFTGRIEASPLEKMTWTTAFGPVWVAFMTYAAGGIGLKLTAKIFYSLILGALSIFHASRLPRRTTRRAGIEIGA